MNTLVFLIILLSSPLLIARDFIQFRHFQSDMHNYSSNEYSFSLPPIKADEIMLLNGFKAVDSADKISSYRQFRWAPGLLWQKSENSNLLISSPVTYGVTGNDYLMSKDAANWNMIISLGSRRFTPGIINWSYGLLALDLTGRSRIFPILGLAYLSEDSLWRSSLGYPAMAITYLGFKQAEMSLFFSRELNKFRIQDSDPLSASGKYIEQNLNLLGISTQFKFGKFLNVGISYSKAFSSRYKFLDASQTDNGNSYLDYSNAGFVQFSVGMGLNNPR